MSTAISCNETQSIHTLPRQYVSRFLAINYRHVNLVVFLFGLFTSLDTQANISVINHSSFSNASYYQPVFSPASPFFSRRVGDDPSYDGGQFNRPTTPDQWAGSGKLHIKQHPDLYLPAIIGTAAHSGVAPIYRLGESLIRQLHSHIRTTGAGPRPMGTPVAAVVGAAVDWSDPAVAHLPVAVAVAPATQMITPLRVSAFVEGGVGIANVIQGISTYRRCHQLAQHGNMTMSERMYCTASFVNNLHSGATSVLAMSKMFLATVEPANVAPANYGCIVGVGIVLFCQATKNIASIHLQLAMLYGTNIIQHEANQDAFVDRYDTSYQTYDAFGQYFILAGITCFTFCECPIPKRVPRLCSFGFVTLGAAYLYNSVSGIMGYPNARFVDGLALTTLYKLPSFIFSCVAACYSDRERVPAPIQVLQHSGVLGGVLVTLYISMRGYAPGVMLYAP